MAEDAEARRRRDMAGSPPVNPADWHSPRDTHTRHLGSKLKTPLTRLGGGLEGTDGTVAAVRAIARETRERKAYGDWENEGAPERSRRVAIQAAVGSASRRRALTARDKLPRLGAPEEKRRGGGVRHKEIAAIVAGQGSVLPKTPWVAASPRAGLAARADAARGDGRPLTVRTMCRALS